MAVNTPFLKLWIVFYLLLPKGALNIFLRSHPSLGAHYRRYYQVKRTDNPYMGYFLLVSDMKFSQFYRKKNQLIRVYVHITTICPPFVRLAEFVLVDKFVFRKKSTLPRIEGFQHFLFGLICFLRLSLLSNLQFRHLTFLIQFRVFARSIFSQRISILKLFKNLVQLTPSLGIVPRWFFFCNV